MRTSQAAGLKAGIIVGLTVAGAIAIFSSCGGSDGDGGDDVSKKEVVVEGESLAVEVGQVAVTFDSGALAAGTEVTLAEAATPAEFSALSGVPAASKAYDLLATKDGQDVEEATKPFTLAISLDAAAALADVEAKAANLCVLLKAKATKYVWRAAALTGDDAKKTFKLSTSKFGTYMAAYCGSEALEGFTDVNSSSAKTLQLCDVSTKDKGECSAWPADFANDTEKFAAATALCKDYGGTMAVGTACPTANLIGTCNVANGGNFKSSVAYYTGTEEQAKSACQSIANASATGDVIAFIKPDGTSSAVTKATSNVSSFPFGCYQPESKSCQLYMTGNTGNAAEMAAYCTENLGEVATTCPSASFTDSCAYSSQFLKYYFYTGSTNGGSANCTSTGGTYSETYSAN